MTDMKNQPTPQQLAPTARATHNQDVPYSVSGAGSSTPGMSTPGSVEDLTSGGTKSAGKATMQCLNMGRALILVFWGAIIHD